MHIPDGYLSPQTYLPAFGAMLPLWAIAAAKVQRTLRARQVPLLALGAAFSFVIMMFNVPIPGGTTGHAAGAVLIAILLGPWAAVIAVSLALTVQALLFGDGGITALAANCLNLAVIMPFVGWGAYRLLAGPAPTSRRQWLAGAVGGYLGLNAAALTTAFMFGIQPLIAPGQYAPYGLAVAVPIMAAEHLLVFGFVEALVTGLVLAYLQRTAPEMLPARVAAPARTGFPLRRLAIGLGVLVLLSPLGILVPHWLGAGGAWGEWAAADLGHLVGYVPTQLARLAALWHAPLAGYAVGAEGAPLWVTGLWYLASAALGAGVLTVLVLGARRWLRHKEDAAPAD